MSTEMQRAAEEELKLLRFCHICGQLIQLKVYSYRYPRIYFSCPHCGEIILYKERKIIPREQYQF
jgi:DNA-directed RNA polymerase subunit RPC12/RpoP